MSMTIVYDGRYEPFKKSVEKESGLFINVACTPAGRNTPLYFSLGKEYNPKHNQKQIRMSVKKGSFLMLPEKKSLLKQIQ